MLCKPKTCIIIQLTTPAFKCIFHGLPSPRFKDILLYWKGKVPERDIFHLLEKERSSIR